ncbi:hypothetical protein [Shimia sp.]|uniref:hypothetical protein n=1 Tax=Shimia sp. TaxID=1954381 RepID=UPI00329798D2
MTPPNGPVMAEADSRCLRDVNSVSIQSEMRVQHLIFFVPGQGVLERLNREQLVRWSKVRPVGRFQRVSATL